MMDSLCLVMVLASQFGGGMGGVPGGGAPERRDDGEGSAGRRAQPPTSPELQGLQGLRARFDFARDTGNTASLRALDLELRKLLPAEDAASGAAPLVSPESTPAAPGRVELGRRLTQVAGRFDAPSLKVRSEILSALLLEALHGAERSLPERPPPETAPSKGGRQRRR